MQTMTRSATGLFAIAALTAALAPAARAEQPRAYGDTRLLAPVGDPGSPEGIAIHGHTVFVSGPARFGTAGSGPSKIWGFDRKTGALLQEYVIEGEALAYEHGLSCIAFDGEDRLYALSTQLGLLRIDLVSGAQETYAGPFPSLGGPPALPNDLAFDEAGNCYVTDSLQALIWRVPPGGGTPEIWFRDERLGAAFGPNGIRVSPDRTRIFFTVTGLDRPGKVYTLPLVDHPQPADLAIFHEFPFEGPDGIAFGGSGKLYVCLAVSSEIAVLGPDGAEIGRISNPAFDAPANVTLDNRSGSLLATNHAAFTLDPSHYAVLNVYVDDRAEPLVKPALP
jgi:sugar lactone lactonase YvrE